MSGCTFSGYTFRLNDSSNMDDSPFIDTGEGGTSRTVTIDSQWHNRDLWWGVRAANAPSGSSWAVRRFRIEPGGGTSGNWTANYYDTIDRWNDINNGNNLRCTDSSIGSNLDRNFGSGAPCGGMDGDTWVGDYSGTFNFSPGNYIFHIEHDDGARLWIDGQNRADLGGSGDDWAGCSGGISLNGNHTLRVMLREDGGDARIRVSWTTDLSACGGGSSGTWTARFYDGHDRWWDPNSGNQRCERTYNQTELDQNYGANKPCDDLNSADNWVGDYTTTLNFQGNYTFRVEHDDWLKLWLNGQNISERGSGGYTWLCPARNLSGNVTLRAILRENSGDARIRVSWTTDNVCANAPTNLNANATSPTSIYLTWNDNSSNEESYSLERSPDGLSWSVLATLGANSVSHTDTGLTPSTTYHYRVRAVRSEDGQSSGWSNTAQATTPSGDTTPPTGRMVEPTKDSHTNAASLTLRAEANDSGSGVERVEYWGWSTAPWSNQQWIALGSSTTAPYTVTWNTSGLQDGGVFIIAEIYDYAGNMFNTWGDDYWTVVTIDRTAPVITLSGANPLNVVIGTPYNEPGYSAVDTLEGDISSRVSVSGIVDPNTYGTYTLTYSVSDWASNAATSVYDVPRKQDSKIAQ